MGAALVADQAAGTTQTLLRAPDGATVQRTLLPGGLRVVTESVPAMRSVSFGIWVGVGSRDEKPSLAGATHYLEHLLFKGTKRRSALEIAAVMDAVGGEMNAFTAKEYTCYYARVLDADLPLAVDVVADMVTSSLIRTADVESERNVVLEEIAMHDDDPTDVVHDLFAEALFGDSPLGRPILGTVGSIQALSRRAVAGWYRRRYRPENMVVAASGSLQHAEVVRLVEEAFAAAGMTEDTGARPIAPRDGVQPPGTTGGLAILRRPTEQANLVLGMPGVRRIDDRRFALGVLNNALGGGMSSRLFQEVREKRGLAYSVYSYNAQYADTGLFGVYVGCLPKKIDQVLGICRDELAKVVDGGISDDELARGKGQMRASLVLGLEDTGSRMSRVGKGELAYGELLSVDEILARIDAVTLDDVRAIADEVLGAAPTLAVIGPFEDHDFSAAVAT